MMKYTAILFLAAAFLTTGCEMIRPKAVVPVALNAGGQPAPGAAVQFGGEKQKMSTAKKVGIGLVAAGAVYAAGENWLWHGKGGRHRDGVEVENQLIENQTRLDISDNQGEISVVIFRDGTFGGVEE